MVTRETKPLRYAAEAQFLRRALEGDCEAINRVLLYLSSDNVILRQMMQATFHDLSEARLWTNLLGCLALHKWGLEHITGKGEDCERRADAAASARIDRAIVQAFVEDESPWETEAKNVVLRANLEHESPRVRSAAAYLLALRGDRQVIPVLEELLAGEDLAWKLRAVEALACLGEEECGPVLVRAFAQPEPEVQRAARKALGELGAHAEPALMEALSHPDAHVRWHAARSLGQIGDDRALDILAEKLYDEDSSVRWAAARVLACLDTRAIPAVLRVLSRQPLTEPFRQAAHHALHAMVSRRAQTQVAPLLAALQGPAASVRAPTLAQQMLSRQARKIEK